MQDSTENPASTAFNPYGFFIGMVILLFLFAFAVHYRVRTSNSEAKSNEMGITSNANSAK